MANLDIVIALGAFVIVALASWQIGHYFTRFHLPLISGFLLAGMLVGPYELGILDQEAIGRLRFLDEISLAFIAFAAGSELYLEDIRGRLRSIGWITLGNALIIPLAGSTAIYLLSGWIPFMQEMSSAARLAASLLGGAILVARSPSSTIAVVNELRAKGPFTQTIIGVTMIIDVVVIVLFTLSSEFADAVLTELAFSPLFVGLLLAELIIALILGLLLGKVLELILSLNTRFSLKAGLVLLTGYAIFVISMMLRDWTHNNFSIEILLEPLLVCMIGGIYVANRSKYRAEFLNLQHKIGPAVYIVFFTLTGASLALDVLGDTWAFALALFFIRLAAIFLGSFAGGIIAGDPMKHNRLGWLSYITQAGVGLGLAKEVAVEFPQLGNDFTTLIIAVIVMSQLVGPPFIKWTIQQAGEARTRGESAGFDGVREALIFGLEDQSMALARELQTHGWQVRLVCLEESYYQQKQENNSPIYLIGRLDLAALQELEAENADAIVTLLSDGENYQICELAYEHFGIENMVVRLNDRANTGRFQELGAHIVDPSTAMVSLLDHSVRSPVATSLLLGTDASQDIIDIEVRDPSLDGIALRDLRLPEDILILSINRRGHTIISHGYTRLRLGDWITVLGAPENLEQVMLRFAA